VKKIERDERKGVVTIDKKKDTGALTGSDSLFRVKSQGGEGKSRVGGRGKSPSSLTQHQRKGAKNL